jgi:hypothetical protein
MDSEERTLVELTIRLLGDAEKAVFEAHSDLNLAYMLDQMRRIWVRKLEQEDDDHG